MMNKPELLVKYIRDGLVEQEHFGYVLVANRERVIDRIGRVSVLLAFLRKTFAGKSFD